MIFKLVIFFRDALRKINVAVHNFGKVLTDYLTNCEEELNNTIVNQLVNGDRLRENFSTSFEGDSICDISDMNAEEGVKKVHFAPDVTELLASFCSDHDFTSNRSVSVFESKLNACLERLKNEAAAVLCLTAGKKMDADDVRLTVAAQTDLSDDQLRERIKALEKVSYFLLRIVTYFSRICFNVIYFFRDFLLPRKK